MSDCTCHPHDNPLVPCQKKYALGECHLAAAEARIRELEAERDALVAEAYEAATNVVLAVCLEGINPEGCYSETVAREHRKYLSGIRRAGLAARYAIQSLTPADAIASREERDKQAREQALREAAENLKAHAPNLVDGPEHDVGFHYGYHIAVDRILALIKKGQTDD